MLMVTALTFVPAQTTCINAELPEPVCMTKTNSCCTLKLIDSINQRQANHTMLLMQNQHVIFVKRWLPSARCCPPSACPRH